MQTDHPTTEIYFGFAFTFCKLRVYDKQATLARKILDAHGVEYLSKDDSKTWVEFDTRILLDLVEKYLPTLVRNVLPTPEEISLKLRS